MNCFIILHLFVWFFLTLWPAFSLSLLPPPPPPYAEDYYVFDQIIKGHWIRRFFPAFKNNRFEHNKKMDVDSKTGLCGLLQFGLKYIYGVREMQATALLQSSKIINYKQTHIHTHTLCTHKNTIFNFLYNRGLLEEVVSLALQPRYFWNTVMDNWGGSKWCWDKSYK